MDCVYCSVSSVDAGHGQQLHHGRLYSRITGAGDCRIPDQSNQWWQDYHIDSRSIFSNKKAAERRLLISKKKEGKKKRNLSEPIDKVLIPHA